MRTYGRGANEFKAAHQEIKNNVRVVTAESNRTLKFQHERDECSLPNNHTVSYHCEFLPLLGQRKEYGVDLHARPEAALTRVV
jgi:hypothetical protein